MRFESTLRPLTAALLVVGAAAQGDVRDASAAAAAPATAPSAHFRVPIHDADCDGDVAYGIWASGRDYKVAFHDGVAFVPVLGESAPRNLPLRWASTEVRVGTQILEAGSRGIVERGPWRISFRVADGVVEAYDVRDDGVEQTFVLERRLAHAGDLVIRGRLDSELRADDGAFAHAAIDFRDASGRDVVRYGAATVIDATGARLPMQSRHVDGVIELVVPGAWLANAAYPVVVDPLISNVVVDRMSIDPVAIRFVDVAHDPVANESLFVYTRAVSATDHDAYARVTDASFGGSTVVFTDITANWSTRHVSAAFVGRPQKWIVALERAFAAPSESRIRWHMAPSGTRALSTFVSSLALPAGTTHRYPDVGGTRVGTLLHDNALIVFQSDVTATQQNTTNSEVLGVIIDGAAAANGTASTPVVLASNPSGGVYDREWPSVTQSSGAGSDHWIVAYQERVTSQATNTWDIVVRRVTFTGSVLVGPSGSWVDSISPGVESERPQIAGNNGRYLVTYVERDSGPSIGTGTGPRLMARRFDWPTGTPSRVNGPLRVVVDSPTDLIRNRGLAYDEAGRSHWAAVFQKLSSEDLLAVRIGFDAGVAESVVVHGGRDAATTGAVTMGASSGAFTIACATEAADVPLIARSFVFANAATNVYGVACGSGLMGADGVPHAGNEFFEVTIRSGAASAPGTLMLSLAQSALPLDVIGMNGCTMLIDPNLFFFSVGVALNGAGAFDLQLSLPSPIQADLFAQWAYLAPALNSLGIAATSGLRIQIR